MAQQVTRGADLIKRFDKNGGRAFPVQRNGAGNFQNIRSVLHRIQQQADRSIALPFENAVDRPFGKIQHILGDKRNRMPANKLEHLRETVACFTTQIENFRHIGQIAARVAHGIGLELVNQFPVIFVRFGLKVDNPHVVSGIPRSTCHQFQPQRLQPQENLGVHQGAGMNRQNFHDIPFCLLRAGNANGIPPCP